MLPRVVPTLARLLRLGIARPNLSLTRLDAAEPKPAGPMASLEIYTDSLEKRQTEETASAKGTIQTLLELVDKHRGMSRAAAARGQQDAQERLLGMRDALVEMADRLAELPGSSREEILLRLE